MGVVFYEMLTGELPTGRFAPPSEKSKADPRVDEIVLRTLERERERRYQQASQVKADVETITSETGASAASSQARRTQTAAPACLGR
jgi:eukaryotic-like serine/threonine-protein kinase